MIRTYASATMKLLAMGANKGNVGKTLSFITYIRRLSITCTYFLLTSAREGLGKGAVRSFCTSLPRPYLADTQAKNLASPELAGLSTHVTVFVLTSPYLVEVRNFLRFLIEKPTSCTAVSQPLTRITVLFTPHTNIAHGALPR